jgi:hypothetical protein
MSSEMNLELILGDSLDIAISLPLVYYSFEQLVHCEQELLTIGALRYLQLLLDCLQPVLCIHGILGLREGVRTGP